MKRFIALVGLLGVLALVGPGMALASSSSTCQGYGGKSCASVGSGTAGTGSGTGSGTDNAAATVTTSTGTLPFTGLDVVLLVAGGGALLSAGFVVRRLSRQPK